MSRKCRQESIRSWGHDLFREALVGYPAIKINAARAPETGSKPRNEHYYLYCGCQKSRVGPARKSSHRYLKGQRKRGRWPWTPCAATTKTAADTTIFSIKSTLMHWFDRHRSVHFDQCSRSTCAVALALQVRIRFTNVTLHGCYGNTLCASLSSQRGLRHGLLATLSASFGG